MPQALARTAPVPGARLVYTTTRRAPAVVLWLSTRP